MRNNNPISQQFCGRFQRTLRQLKQEDGQTAESLSAMVGIEARTVESHLDGSSSPTLGALALYLSVFGSRLVNALVSPLGISGCHDAGSEKPTDHHLLNSLCETAAVVSKALDDGFVDHQERKQVIEAALELQRKLSAFLSDMAMGKGEEMVPIREITRATGRA